MAEPVPAEFGRVGDRALRRPSTQMRWAREMAIALLRRESSDDAPGGAPPSRLWTLPTHVVDQHPRCKHPHQPHWPRSRVFIGIVIAGMSSYACPFQTPVSAALRGIWKKVRGRVVSHIFHSGRVLSQTHRKWNWGVRRGIVSSKRVLSRMWNHRAQPLLPSQSPPTIPLENIQVQQSEPVSVPDNASQPEPVLMPDTVSQSESLSTPDNVPKSEWWLTRKDLASIRKMNTDDVRCVSWILRNITDPEALDAAIRLAGEIRWFDDGVNVNPPCDLIVSTFQACFDSTGTLYPGSRDRAYYSGRAMMWIHALAGCKSDEFASTFPCQTWDTQHRSPTQTSINFYGSTARPGMLITTLNGFSRSTQVTHTHTCNGFQIYSCIIPGPTGPNWPTGMSRLVSP
jgi:hypothetical protein